MPGWITVSVVSHVLILAAGIGAAPLGRQELPVTLTVDIINVAAPEKQRVISNPQQQVPIAEPHSPLPPPPAPLRGAPREARPRSEGPLRIDNYFHVSELDVRAEPINDVLLRYPWLEYKRRLAGVVRFTLFINAQGGLDKVQLVEGTPPGHFEEAALEAVTKLQFSPARKNGRPVKSQKTIDVVFDPSDDTAMPAKQPDFSVAEK